MFEIASSKLAAQKGDELTKAFANQMIADHTKTLGELKSAVGNEATVDIPTVLDSSHQSKLDTLSKLDGADFLKQYHSDQVSADAVSLFERYGEGGDSERLKSWAMATLPALQHHLEMAQTLDK